MDIASLRGCGTALLTPFNEDLSIDEEALRRHVEFQISSGIDFLVPCGTTGESVTLTDKEQYRVVEITMEAARGRVPVIAGAGSNNTAHVIEWARHYEKMGVDGLLSVTPYYSRPTQEGIYQHYSAIAESTRLPIIIYSIRPRTAVNVLPDTMARLAAIPNIIGVKEGSGDMSQIAEIATLVPPDFKVISGDDTLTLPVIAVGGVGVIAVVSNEAPAQMAALAKACLDNQWEKARRLNQELFPLMRANFLETSPGPVKAAAAMMGRMKEVYRLPMVPVSAATKEKLRTILIEMKLIEGKSVQAD